MKQISMEEKLYQYKKLLTQAVYIINQLNIGYMKAEELLCLVGERVKPNDSTDMVKLFLPEYLHKDSQKFIFEYEKMNKSLKES
jgi:hypothetical protein